MYAATTHGFARWIASAQKPMRSFKSRFGSQLPPSQDAGMVCPFRSIIPAGVRDDDWLSTGGIISEPAAGAGSD